MLKYQKATGKKLSPLLSEAIHWIKNLIKNKNCPKKPKISQKFISIDNIILFF